MSADLVEHVNRHFPPQVLISYLCCHPGTLDSLLLIVGIAYILWYFVAFQKVPLKWKAEAVFVSGFLF